MKNQYRKWMSENVQDCIDGNGEVNMTLLGESCADHFGVMTDKGDSPEEEIIFEVATEFQSIK
jgi:hypothetical protein